MTLRSHAVTETRRGKRLVGKMAMAMGMAMARDVTESSDAVFVKGTSSIRRVGIAKLRYSYESSSSSSSL